MRAAAILSMAPLALGRGITAEGRSFGTRTGVCGDTTWTDGVTTGSAFTNSCVTLLNDMKAASPEMGYVLTGWKKGQKDYLWIGVEGDCVFEVKPLDFHDGQITPIAFADVANIMEDALKIFTVSGDDCFGASGVIDGL
ncbi:hypothetical protein F5B22DRAFT_610268 [Xylaria bambusicola]|uniref:uncharacterized protein n=1 Tax=Xylaria bambusicola TaxID=326684 RepID=UPI00200827C2|nr:uncharacterized protein F5B22DRAFT_610268 [Xylaria bambusicola]KAI0514659.1 hypothetical protein F5B22DRAFT_610268 [Xylaria bambusicola]